MSDTDGFVLYVILKNGVVKMANRNIQMKFDVTAEDK